jgi:hypothetical protein
LSHQFGERWELSSAMQLDNTIAANCNFQWITGLEASLVCHGFWKPHCQAVSPSEHLRLHSASPVSTLYHFLLLMAAASETEQVDLRFRHIIAAKL